MKNILQEIVNYKKIEIEKSKKVISVEILNKKIKSLSKPLKFLDELRNKNEVGKAGIIAEVKKASPSKGIIKKDFNHIETVSYTHLTLPTKA